MEHPGSEAEQAMVEEIMERRQKVEDGVVDRSIVVPVNQAVTARHKVLTTEQMRGFLKQSDVVAITKCECRARLKNCNAPVDNCIVLDRTAEQVAESEEYQLVTIDEAMEVLDRTAEAGLVHLTLWSEDHTPFAVCSCCSCCCHELLTMFEFGYLDHVLTSDFVAEHDEEDCASCGTCVERCHFGAFTEVDDVVSFERDKCFGCGVCVMTCPSEAVTLVPRT
jgi:uncharacterized Fe-S center protein